MNAVVHDRYGPPEVLRFGDVERPVPKEAEVLDKIHATTATRTKLRHSPRQRILGTERAGEVDVVGEAG